MELQVFGKVLNVRDLVIKLAEEKAVEMPVIVFCTEIDEYKELLPECHIFVDSDVGVQLAVLDSIKHLKRCIVLTTSKDSRGVDFVFAGP